MRTGTRGVVGLRRRALVVLFVGVACASTSYLATFTAASIVAGEVAGPTVAGLPATFGVIGAAVGSGALSAFMARRGRRLGLVVGYAIGALGAGMMAVGAQTSNFMLLVIGSGAGGIGMSAGHLSRYAAADMFESSRRASALGAVVWASTVGAVAGPSLLDPTSGWAADRGLVDLTGPFVAGCVLFALAAVLLAVLMPEPTSLLADDAPGPVVAPVASLRLGEAWARPSVQVAIVVMAASQFVMVLIMAMTPLHMRHLGHGLGPVGFVMTFHVLGMYALSPVVGRLADSFGPQRVLVGGLAVLVGAGALSASAGASTPMLAAGLFTLGLGWSLAFVSGSSLLTKGLTYAERTRLQGTVDALVWSSAALASFGSGAILGLAGYVALCLTGSALVGFPVFFLLSRRRALAA